jgi:outer membrane protein assembly factor BamB
MNKKFDIAMKFAENTNKRGNLIALILLSILVISLVPLSTIDTASAAFTWHPYLTASPNPVGVGQQVIIVFGFTMPTQSAANSYYGWTLTITDPDGNNKTATGLNAESTGSSFYTFTPEKIGNWTLSARYPGGYAIMSGGLNLSVPAADTNVFHLTVQEEQIPGYQNTPLPSAYWEFPIYGENQAWSQIAGNWLMSGYDNERDFDASPGAFNPYTTVPNSAHILWTKQQLFGGIVGGNTSMTYYTGESYRRELMPPVIINGRLYYNMEDPPAYGFECVDLATGESLWYNNGTYPDGNGGFIEGEAAGITFGQVLTLDTMNWHGGMPFLWSVGDLPWDIANPTWAVRNAYNGNLLFTIANATTPFFEFGRFFIDQPTGTLLACIIDTYGDRLIMWNSTRLIEKTIGINGFYDAAPTLNLDWNAGVQLNVTIPHIEVPFSNWLPTTTDPKDPSVIIVNTQAAGEPQAGEPFNEIAFSLKDGRMLWNKTRDVGTWEAVVGGKTMSIAEDCYVSFRKETRQLYVFSVATGEQKLVSEPRSSQWGMYDQGIIVAYGKVYSIAYDGMVYAYDAKTGNKVWTWDPVNSGLETPYGVYPLYGGIVAADNKIIVSNGEHSANSPLYRGERMYIIDAENGTTVWSVDGWYQQPSAANGIIVAPNGYDGKIYCFGKGPSAVTVNAPSVGVTTATPITISGTVTDVSAGASQSAVAKNFPNGLPCVSDESQSQWMSHVYQQQPLPLNTTGVPVTLSVIDSNDNFREIGTTITNAGTYAFTWTPDIPGNFQVIASFGGSVSYYPSSAYTYFYASEASTPAPTQITQTGLATTSDLMMYIVAAIIANIIVSAIIALLIIRKRP